MGSSYAISFLLCFSSLGPRNVTVKKAGILSEEESLHNYHEAILMAQVINFPLHFIENS